MENKRPTERDPSIINAIADKLKTEVYEWLREGGVEEIKDELVEMLEDTDDWDGYVLTHWLEDVCGYCECDSELVRILDETRGIANKLVVTATKDWVEKYNIQPQLKVGDKVRIKGINQIGTILNTHDYLTKYVVDTGDGHNYVIEWERCELL